MKLATATFARAAAAGRPMKFLGRPLLVSSTPRLPGWVCMKMVMWEFSLLQVKRNRTCRHTTNAD